MKLIDYINKNYDGVVLRFANDNDMKRQQVEQCIRKGYYYVVQVEGDVMLAIAKRKIKSSGVLSDELSDFKNPKNWTRSYNCYGNLINEHALYVPKLPKDQRAI